MKSRWSELKPTAFRLRKNGFSIRDIEKRLGIPRSTLSGWLQSVELSREQSEKLLTKWKEALVRARKKAAEWHHTEKKKRLQEAEKQALAILKKVDATDTTTLELTLSFLYLGEGSKKNVETALGSSDPLILQFFLSTLRKLYKLDTKELRYELCIRADQNPTKVKRFWAKALDAPLRSFKQVNVDKRTLGSKTYPHYNGVCNIRCSNVAIQRKLLALSRLFCDRVASKY